MDENDDENITFDRNIQEVGSETLIMSLPKPLREWLKISKGDSVRLMPKKGKYGKYFVCWKKDQEKTEEKQEKQNDR